MKPLFVIVGLVFCAPVQAAQVVPNFTRGVVTSETTTSQTITEVIRQVEYTTGESYTVSGTNINIPGNPGLGKEDKGVENKFGRRRTREGP